MGTYSTCGGKERSDTSRDILIQIPFWEATVLQYTVIQNYRSSPFRVLKYGCINLEFQTHFLSTIFDYLH